MPNADKCYLNIPFKETLSRLTLDEEGRLNPTDLATVQQEMFQNFKAIELRINDPACGTVILQGGVLKPLTVSGSSTDAENYTTQPVALDADKLYLACFMGKRVSGDLGAITATQTGATWDVVNFANWAALDIRTYIFRCQPTSNVAAAGITFDAPTTSVMTYGTWQIIEFENAYVDSANNGAGAIIQSVSDYLDSNTTSATLTLGALQTLNNLAFGAFGIGATTTFAATGPGFQQVGLSQPPSDSTILLTEQRRGVFTVDCSWTAGAFWGGVACEIKMAD